jgi:hypothetical protein
VIWTDGKKCGCGNPKCHSPGKHPIGRLAPDGFKDATTNEDTIREWWRIEPKAAVGVATGAKSGILVIDIDTKKGKNGEETLEEIEKELGRLPETKTAITMSDGKHYYFNHVEGIRSGTDVLGPGIDLRGDGGYVVAPPSHRDLYEWEDGGQAVDLPEAWAERLRNPSSFAARAKTQTAPSDYPLVEKILTALPNPPDAAWADWNKVCMATWAATGGSERGFRAFDDWSRKWQGYDAENTRREWDKVSRCPPNDLTIGTLAFLADEHCPGWRGDEKRQLTLRSLDQFEPLDLDWLSDPFVPMGMLTCFYGEGDVGSRRCSSI